MKKVIGTCLLASTFFLACQTTQPETMDLNSDESLKELVTYTYPYVAGFNAISNLTKVPASAYEGVAGWNKLDKKIEIADHRMTAVPRPNNDTLYLISTLDVREEPVIITYPKFDSNFIALEVSSFDHSINVPLATKNGDFQRETTVLFYSDLTKNYTDFDEDNYDAVVKLSGSLGTSFVRAMPHQVEPIRLEQNLSAIKNTTIQTYSEYHNVEAPKVASIKLPAFGTDAIVYGGDLLGTMQFIVDHLSFENKNDIDKKMLSIVKRYGVEPNKQNEYAELNTEKVLIIMQELKRDIAIGYGKLSVEETLNLFKPNAESTIEELLTATVLGPLGLPAEFAVYPKITTEDGQNMNAMYDYKISMTIDELPPADAFWSFTVYDTENFLFIPNEQYKYSVGANAGMKLDENGGIAIYISAEKPEGVPAENWIPINRKEELLGVTLRMYEPNIEEYIHYTLPIIEKID